MIKDLCALVRDAADHVVDVDHVAMWRDLGPGYHDRRRTRVRLASDRAETEKAALQRDFARRRG